MASSGFMDLEQLARQYWGAWGEAMRAQAAPAQPPVPGWNEALDWWSQLARNAGAGQATGADDAVARFNSQAQQWLGQMQQLAAQFAGSNASPADVAAAWQRMLGAGGANPMADLFKTMQGPGQHGIDQWMEQMAPLLRSMQSEAHGWLGMPAFGFAREHQERWQALAQAQLDYQEKTQAYNALMAEATQDALRRFERKLAEHSEPGQQIGSARALFDLWIDAAEEAYADIALSPRFSETYGEWINAQMRVRAGVQREVEQYCSQLGIPTRSEIDAAHRKITQLEREVRRLRDSVREHEPDAVSTATRARAASAGPEAGTEPDAEPANRTAPARAKKPAPPAKASATTRRSRR